MKTIDQFMWGFQEHFRANFQHLARSALELIGFEGETTVLLVGLADAGHKGHHPVCIEPENGRWEQEMFATLPETVERAIDAHPLQRMHYGDRQAMRDKPENIRRLAITQEVLRHIRPDDDRNGVRSFCSRATKVGDFYVVTIIQVSERSLLALPTIRYRRRDEEAETNLVLECITQVLDQAEYELARPAPEPGREIGSNSRLRPKEIAERAAQLLMRVPFIQGDRMNPGLFGPLEEISKLMYEGTVGTGRLVFAAADDPNLNYVLKLSTPVLLSQTRWLRKILQMATQETALIAGYSQVFGLGSMSDLSAAPYVIDIVGHHQWDLRRGEQLFMRVKAGQPRLPQDPIENERLKENMRRIFDEITDASIARAQNVMELLFQMGRGSMIVFAQDAAAEAERFESQGTRIQPVAINRELLERASSIDGTILADPQGVCHAVGVILDGDATSACTPARGARYNSAVRYVGDGSTGRLALIFSDDGTLDVVPLLRPLVDGDLIEKAVQAIVSASLDDYHQPRNFLEENRFYLNEDQCQRVNMALDRIESEPRGGGRLVLVTDRFSPDPEMNESYLKKKKRDRGR